MNKFFHTFFFSFIFSFFLISFTEAHQSPKGPLSKKERVLLETIRQAAGPDLQQDLQKNQLTWQKLLVHIQKMPNGVLLLERLNKLVTRQKTKEAFLQTLYENYKKAQRPQEISLTLGQQNELSQLHKEAMQKEGKTFIPEYLILLEKRSLSITPLEAKAILEKYITLSVPEQGESLPQLTQILAPLTRQKMTQKALLENIYGCLDLIEKISKPNVKILLFSWYIRSLIINASHIIPQNEISKAFNFYKSLPPQHKLEVSKFMSFFVTIHSEIRSMITETIKDPIFSPAFLPNYISLYKNVISLGQEDISLLLHVLSQEAGENVKQEILEVFAKFLSQKTDPTYENLLKLFTLIDEKIPDFVKRKVMIMDMLDPILKIVKAIPEWEKIPDLSSRVQSILLKYISLIEVITNEASRDYHQKLTAEILALVKEKSGKTLSSEWKVLLTQKELQPKIERVYAFIEQTEQEYKSKNHTLPRFGINFAHYLGAEVFKVFWGDLLTLSSSPYVEKATLHKIYSSLGYLLITQATLAGFSTAWQLGLPSLVQKTHQAYLTLAVTDKVQRAFNIGKMERVAHLWAHNQYWIFAAHQLSLLSFMTGTYFLTPSNLRGISLSETLLGSATIITSFNLARIAMARATTALMSRVLFKYLFGVTGIAITGLEFLFLDSWNKAANSRGMLNKWGQAFGQGLVAANNLSFSQEKKDLLPKAEKMTKALKRIVSFLEAQTYFNLSFLQSAKKSSTTVHKGLSFLIDHLSQEDLLQHRINQDQKDLSNKSFEEQYESGMMPHWVCRSEQKEHTTTVDLLSISYNPFGTNCNGKDISKPIYRISSFNKQEDLVFNAQYVPSYIKKLWNCLNTSSCLTSFMAPYSSSEHILDSLPRGGIEKKTKLKVMFSLNEFKITLDSIGAGTLSLWALSQDLFQSSFDLIEEKEKYFLHSPHSLFYHYLGKIEGLWLKQKTISPTFSGFCLFPLQNKNLQKASKEAFQLWMKPLQFYWANLSEKYKEVLPKKECSKKIALSKNEEDFIPCLAYLWKNTSTFSSLNHSLLPNFFALKRIQELALSSLFKKSKGNNGTLLSLSLLPSWMNLTKEKTDLLNLSQGKMTFTMLQVCQ